MRKRRKRGNRIPGAVLLAAILLAAVLWNGFFPALRDWVETQTGKAEGVVTAERLAEDPLEGMEKKLTVSFLDVGQGNAVFIRSGGQCMLVDGGPAEASSYVVRFLKNQGVEKLDYVIATHYDADHISGLIGVLNRFQVGLLLNPDYEADTHIYSSYIRKRDENGCLVHAPARGERYTLGDAEFTIVSPASYDILEDNNNSIGIRLTCGDTAFLMLGDTDQEGEREMLSSGLELAADVYLASHHGSASSGSRELLERVRPSWAVISVGADNPFGHPAESTLQRFRERDIPVFRTDLQGSVTAASDGAIVRFDREPVSEAETGKAAAESLSAEPEHGRRAVIGNKISFKFHRQDCENLPAEHNRIWFSGREEALEAGFDPCGSCRP